ncbi:hypothetical protein SAMN05192568_103074 [Methylobacterium pseudosasicola]|uniref:Uncharacterized protein n=1 Tax=Methylobacterium pseudosasicola TaxID=582667 RepID=A0A1I4QMV9_9HYPH|nr:hypothetical protein SAMN05192568_103074 [Methylobacterium pseudosasicola]
MSPILTPAVALVAWAIGVVTGIVLMARHEVPNAPMTDPPRWERSL